MRDFSSARLDVLNSKLFLEDILAKIDILSLEFDELLQIFLDVFKEKKFRASQVFDWLHNKKVSSFEEMSNVSSALRTKLSDYFYIDQVSIAKKLESKLDPTVKYLYKLSYNNHIESVLMEYKHGNSLCISTQVGCKMGCKFCASTLAGFARHLTPAEMLLQVYNAEKDSGKHVDSIVLMGIGEPLDNYDNVVKFLKLISDERGKNLSLRHVSLSTCGLVDRIYSLAEYKFGLTLSISLHATTNAKRSEIMPINQRFSIEDLLEACRFYINKTGRRISFEYAVIENGNDKKADAD